MTRDYAAQLQQWLERHSYEGVFQNSKWMLSFAQHRHEAYTVQRPSWLNLNTAILGPGPGPADLSQGPILTLTRMPLSPSPFAVVLAQAEQPRGARL